MEPEATTKGSASPLRFGVVGTNFISDWFVDACRRTHGRAEAVAVLSRGRESGEAFAARHAITQVFQDLAEMAETVDAVYVASPNAAHHGQAIQAIEAGRHVLVEKVMGTSATQVDEIFDAARQHAVVAMEATRHLHAPAQELLREALPRVGVLRQVRFAKCQYSSRYDRFLAGERLNAFDPSLENSALADIGVYVLQAAVDLFGTPLSRTGSSIHLANGFEGAGSMTLTHDGFLVDLSWSKITQGVGPSVILGEDGAITVDDLAEPSLIQLHQRGGAVTTLLDAPTSPAQTMHHEIEAFAAQVAAGVTNPRWTEVTCTSRRLMDEHFAATPPVSRRGHGSLVEASLPYSSRM